MCTINVLRLLPSLFFSSVLLSFVLWSVRTTAKRNAWSELLTAIFAALGRIRLGGISQSVTYAHMPICVLRMFCCPVGSSCHSQQRSVSWDNPYSVPQRPRIMRLSPPAYLPFYCLCAFPPAGKTMKVDGIKKEVNKKLPNLTAALRKELGNWQNEEGFPFR